jgi:hypothetical protein
MWKPRQARRLPVLSALIAGSALTVGPGTIGAFAGRVRSQPSC